MVQVSDNYQYLLYLKPKLRNLKNVDSFENSNNESTPFSCNIYFMEKKNLFSSKMKHFNDKNGLV